MEIRQEFDKSCLYVDFEYKTDINFIIHMLTENDIEGVVNCKLSYAEEDKQLVYDVSNKISLKALYEAKVIEKSDILQLISDLNCIYKEANEYFLQDRDFVIDPEWMFYDLYKEKLELIYVPGKRFNEKRYSKLAEFFLERINQKDEICVKLAYMFYRFSKEEYFSLGAFLNVIEKETIEENFQKELYTETKIEEKKEEDNLLLEEKADYKKSVVLFLCFISGVVLYYAIRRISVYAGTVLILAVLFAVMSAVSVVKNIIIVRKEREEHEIEKEMEDVSLDDFFGEAKTEYFNQQTEFYNIEKVKIHQLEWKEKGIKQNFSIKSFPVLIGKLEGEVDCRIDDPSVSRRHAKLDKQGNDLFLYDMASTNGTFVDGKQIPGMSNIKVTNNSEIFIGNVYLKIC